MTLASNGPANFIMFRWTYADATARAAASGFVTADLYSVALQLDNATAWILTATTPTWVALAGSGMTNPMTTAGDLILGGSSGTAGRLAKGADSTVLTIDPSTHLPVWAAAAAASFVGAHAYHSANQSVTSATFTILSLDSERYDTDTMHDLVTNNSRVTCKTAGKFHLDGKLVWAANGTGERALQLYLNGATVLDADVQFPNGGDICVMHVSADYALAVNDYVELRAYQGSGGALNSVATANYGPSLSAARLG